MTASDVKYHTRTFAAYNVDEKVRTKSSSGGIFCAVAKRIICEGGVVYGAAFDDNWEVRHIACESMDELPKLMQSKYVQSAMDNVYQSIAEQCRASRKVLFCGTPCQVYGLLSFLEHKQVDTRSLMTVDFICHGVPSRRVWRTYLAELSRGKTIESINFRDKTYGWRDYSLKIDYSDGTKYLMPWHRDPYAQGFIHGLYLRESCYECVFKGIDRRSDLTMADFWGVHLRMPEFFDDKGTSILMIHSEKAMRVLEDLSDTLKIQEIDNEVVVQTNPSAVRSVARNSKRNEFYSNVWGGESIIKQITAKTRVSLIIHAKRIVKRLLKL